MTKSVQQLAKIVVERLGHISFSLYKVILLEIDLLTSLLTMYCDFLVLMQEGLNSHIPANCTTLIFLGGGGGWVTPQGLKKTFRMSQQTI